MREELPREFPGVTFSFPPADIVSQILNFGSPAPIDLQIRGANLDANFDYANSLLPKIRAIPGVADARIQQSRQSPVFNVDVDRTRAQYVGVTTRDVTNSLVVNLAGSSQVAPTFWLNPQNGVSYPIVMQTPQYRLDSLAALANLPIGGTAGGAPQVLGGLANFTRNSRQRAWSASTTSSRWCRSTRPRRTAISARSRPTSASVAGRHRERRAEGLDASCCSARCARWTARSPACCSACSARSC